MRKQLLLLTVITAFSLSGCKAQEVKSTQAETIIETSSETTEAPTETPTTEAQTESSKEVEVESTEDLENLSKELAMKDALASAIAMYQEGGSLEVSEEFIRDIGNIYNISEEELNQYVDELKNFRKPTDETKAPVYVEQTQPEVQEPAVQQPQETPPAVDNSGMSEAEQAAALREQMGLGSFGKPEGGGIKPGQDQLIH